MYHAYVHVRVNVMNSGLGFYIPELRYTFYGPIVFISILAGIATACIIMKKADVRKETSIYTALLTFVSIIICSAVISISLAGDIRKVGFVGAGGALGLILGATMSAVIFRDHIAESVCAWIVSAPLMYGLSKIACHVAGCCNGIVYHGILHVTYGAKGDESYFPVQLTETVAFLMIFAVGLWMYIKLSDRMKTAMIILFVSGMTKIILEFLRESHHGQIISGYQIVVFLITISGVISINFIKKFSGGPGQ